MAYFTHSGRITGPVHYLRQGGVDALIPLGACVVEQLEARSVDVFWGDGGEETAALSLEALEAAASSGRLVMLD